MAVQIGVVKIDFHILKLLRFIASTTYRQPDYKFGIIQRDLRAMQCYLRLNEMSSKAVKWDIYSTSLNMI